VTEGPVRIGGTGGTPQLGGMRPVYELPPPSGFGMFGRRGGALVTLRIGALLTHPVQYYSPWFRALARRSRLTVYYAHQQTAEGQAQAGFSKGFEWDVPLLDGYEWQWLRNVSRRPGLVHFDGCDTPEISDIIRRERFDAFLMFGWNRKSMLQAGWAAKRTSTPLLIRLDSNLLAPRSWLKSTLKRPFYSAVLPQAGHFLSPGIRTDAYLRHYRVPDSRIHRLAHMIDTDRFAEGATTARRTGAAAALRTAHGAGDGHHVLLFVGKLIPRKRPRLLLEALLQLRVDNPEAAARVQLWLVGDGPQRQELEALANANNLPVKFLGFVNQSALPATYAAADCLVLPSNGEETWGLVVNEAFACGVPAIVSDEAGCAPELIFEDETGWLIRRPDAGHLAALFDGAVKRARDLPRAALVRLSTEGGYEAGVAAFLETAGAMSRGPAMRAGPLESSHQK
jgi:glycosyltransferase involved in cell wall biosynthesis